MRFVTHKALTYTVKGDPRWVADKLRQYIAQSGEELEIFQAGPIDGEQFNITLRSQWKWHGVRYAITRRPGGLFTFPGRITVSDDGNRVVVAYEIDFTSALVIGGLSVGVLLLFMAVPLVFSADKSRLSPLVPLIAFPCAVLWFGLGFIVLEGLPLLAVRHHLGRFLKGTVSKFFRLMVDLGTPIDVVDSR